MKYFLIVAEGSERSSSSPSRLTPPNEQQSTTTSFGNDTQTEHESDNE